MKIGPRAVWGLLEDRTGIAKAIRPILAHPVPKRLGWWYVFGSSTMALLVLQIVTGVCLAVVYPVSAAHSYQALKYMDAHQPFGAFLRSLHYWGATAMVVLLLLHMLRVFLMGAYKYPREMTWIVGVFLLLVTLGMAFTGQVLRWDSDAYWGVSVGAAMTGRIPLIGPYLVHGLLGGPNINSETLSHFFALHVFILTGLLLGLLGLHLYLVLKKGISPRPTPGKLVDPATEDAEYEKVLEEGEPFFPAPFMKDVIVASSIIVGVVALAFILGPKQPGGPPDPTVVHAEPRPDWEFLPFFALLALSPAKLETVLMLGLPPLIGLILLLVPVFGNKGERSARRRPLAVLTAVLTIVALVYLGFLGNAAPWSPHMTAWKDTPLSPSRVKDLTPLELQGAVLFQEKTCVNCHAVDGRGGRRGPDLTRVASRLSRPELVRQVIQGGGLMPAFGKELSPSEVTAIVAFLRTLGKPVKGAADPAGATGDDGSR